jgi:DNA adenine methylase
MSESKVGNLKPFIKWPGGKTSELEFIDAYAPKKYSRFFDPFVGGGSVLFSIPVEIKSFANDLCKELIDLYNFGGIDSNFSTRLLNLADQWDALHFNPNEKKQLIDLNFEALSKVGLDLLVGDLEFNNLVDYFHLRLEIDLPKKLARIKKIEADRNTKISQEDFFASMEGILKSSLYMAIRSRYNQLRTAGIYNADRTIYFYFLREYCYAAMFRFNKSDEFNIPYGGISYNDKSLIPKIKSLTSPEMQARLNNTIFSSVDFRDFIETNHFNEDDFIFVDPPYDSTFNDYDGKSFSMLALLPHKATRGNGLV